MYNTSNTKSNISENNKCIIIYDVGKQPFSNQADFSQNHQYERSQLRLKLFFRNKH